MKVETRHTLLTGEGNLINYPGNVIIPIADLTNSKVFLNSTIYTWGAPFMTSDIKNFYLNTLLNHYKYMQLDLNQVPKEIVLQYNLQEISKEGYVYLKVWKLMYGLPQAGMVSINKLTKHLAIYGYTPTSHNPSLWRHQRLPIHFTLVVDNFGVKYFGQQHN